MKNILGLAWNEFVFGGHLLAVGLVCMVTFPAILLGIHITWDFAAVVYLTALTPCIFGRYIGLKEDALTNPERSKYLEKKARMVPYLIALLTIALIGILFYFHKYNILLFGIALILLSFFYDLYLKGLTKIIIGFKNFLVGLIFSLLVVMLIIYYNYPLSASFWLVILFIYIMAFMGAAFCDIKDIESDKREGLKTFAAILGRKVLLISLGILLFLAVVPIILGVRWGLFPNYALMLALVIPYNLVLFNESQKNKIRSDLLYGAIFDSQLMWWLVFVLVGKVLIK